MCKPELELPTGNPSLEVGRSAVQPLRSAVTSLAVYGGTPIERHYRALRHAPRVVVGTPGRLLDLAGSGHLYLGAVTWLVMDEADEIQERGRVANTRHFRGPDISENRN